jgi:uroporphyrinogen III methyltransferase / synthase
MIYDKENSHNQMMNGIVYLVGAGVGGTKYLTRQAERLIATAEVLVYDALVEPELLHLVPNYCLTINMGKRGGLPSSSQKEIDRVLVDYCRQGKRVVRLKSGDPLVFGRANEEIAYLQESGCSFELVAGISSILAAPLLAGIPLTDKDLSSCFAVASGHNPDLLDWETLSRIDTLVILMAGSVLGKIVEKLLPWKSANTPIAIVRNCGRKDQEIWIGNLDDIVAKTEGIFLSPCVIIIGEVIKLRTMSPATYLPLMGKTILVTRAAEQASNFTNLLEGQGAKVIEMPALEIVPPSSWFLLDEAIKNLSEFNWLILTSANAVTYFFDRLFFSGKDSRALAHLKIAVVGKKTAAVLQTYHIKPDFIPPNFVADSLVMNFPETLTEQKILFPRVETGGREVLVKELSEGGAIVVEVPAYQSTCPAKMDDRAWLVLQQKQIDIITFASSKTVKNFVILLTDTIEKNESDLSKEEILNKLKIASIGPETSKSCRELFDRVDLEAQEYTLEGLTAEIVKYFSS